MGEKTGFFARLKMGLKKSREGFADNIEEVFLGHEKLDEEFYEELEEVLIMGDVGVNTTSDIIETLQDKCKKEHIKDTYKAKPVLIDELKERLSLKEDAYDFENETTVVLVVGVNGVGKTTTVGKLAARMNESGHKTLVAAADTFRAAANAQLEEWAKRANVDIITSKEGTDPSSVVFDAVNAAKARKTDILICDTAGRLHNKKNLMEELRKMNRVIDREMPGVRRETWIVLDATTGQNALNQAKEFKEVTDLSGIVLTKMDGTAKGGIAIAISSELDIPVKYIGVGEGIDDLQKFNPDEFIDAIFTSNDKKDETTGEE
ncbi:MAG: signal recognition particle-docking protein FtsY [Lachnospiraceae bacterium]|nr:signal recognition particle-docking protein FtsY [Lachnospiraceae bacterium]